MTFDEFREITSNYVGKLQEGVNPFSKKPYICFSNVNLLTSYYNNGTICKQEKVYCEIKLNVYDHGIALTGYEQTYAIKGGFSTEATIKQLEYNLQRYNFTKKNFIQLTLF